MRWGFAWVVMGLLWSGCRQPLLRRLDVPPSPVAGETPGWFFRPGMAGSETNLWLDLSGPTGPRTLGAFDGTSWRSLELPTVLSSDELESMLEVEALRDDGVLLLGRRKAGGPVVAGRLQRDGTFSDLSAALSAAPVGARQGALIRVDEALYARLGDAVFTYDGTTFVPVPQADLPAVVSSFETAFFTRFGDELIDLANTPDPTVPVSGLRLDRLELRRSVRGGPIETVPLRREPGDLQNTPATTFFPLALARGVDGSRWLVIQARRSPTEFELLFRRIEGDLIIRDERLGIDLAECQGSTFLGACALARPVSGRWPAGRTPTFAAGDNPFVSSFLVPIADLRR